MGRLLAGFLVLAGLWGAGKGTVVFDTDSGLFGDDGAALVMLLRSPSQVSVQAITIVPGNVWGRQGAEYMFHILDLLKRANLTVAMGADGPLIHTAAMAKESERRWGTLSYIGAFAQDAAAVIPAPGSKLTGRKPRRKSGASKRKSISLRLSSSSPASPAARSNPTFTNSISSSACGKRWATKRAATLSRSPTPAPRCSRSLSATAFATSFMDYLRSAAATPRSQISEWSPQIGRASWREREEILV